MLVEIGPIGFTLLLGYWTYVRFISYYIGRYTPAVDVMVSSHDRRVRRSFDHLLRYKALMPTSYDPMCEGGRGKLCAISHKCLEWVFHRYLVYCAH